MTTVDLTKGELGLVDRALRVYASHFQQQLRPDTHPIDRADLLAKIRATDALLAKLRAARGVHVPEATHG